MRVDDLIDKLPTQYKMTDQSNTLRSGHSIPKIAEWTSEDGLQKAQDVSRKRSGYTETLACPIIVVVSEKIGDAKITLTVTGKVAKKKDTVTKTQGEQTISYDKYEDSGTTKETTVTIPAHTRPGATFLLTGLGNKIFGIESVTDDITQLYNPVGKVEFFALASSGSKIIYWMGIHKLSQLAKEILRPWIAPSKCIRCGGTGIEPGTEDTPLEIECRQCDGFRYSGFDAVKRVQRNIGYDVGLSRDKIPDWDDMNQTQRELVDKFIAKAWTQKWWVTPTVSEIKRLFAHFYGIDEEEIKIEERFSEQEPIWYLDLPNGGSFGTPFDTLTQSNRDLMDYIAKSITPAGVSVFVGFYSIGDFGNMSDFSINRVFTTVFDTSTEHEYAIWGTPRWDFWNGWCECTENFEVDSLSESIFSTDPNAEIVNANDQGRHWVQMDNNSFIEVYADQFDTLVQSGYIEGWVHPNKGKMQFGAWDNDAGVADWHFHIYHQDSGFYDHNDNLLKRAPPHCDHHLSIVFDGDADLYNVRINKETVGTGISFKNAGPIDADTSFMFQVVDDQPEDQCFVDNFGCSFNNDYDEGDNWQRLYPQGWGRDHLGEVSGYDIYERYIQRDNPFML